MVRPTSSVWNHFIKENYFGKKVAICRYCSMKYLSPNATKMKKHIQKCIKRPMDISLDITPPNEEYTVDEEQCLAVQPYNPVCSSDSVQSASDSDLVITSVDCLLSRSVFSDESSPSTSNHKSKKLRRDNPPIIPTFMNAMTSSEAARLDAAFARAIYSVNCPLSLTDNVYWKQFFHHMRPSYKIPSYHDLTNRLLDNEYSNVKKVNMDKINKAQFLTILTDGWSNIRNEGIISFIVATPSLIFHKSIERNHEKYSGRYISEEINKVMNEIGKNKVISLVTDDTGIMKAAWRILKIKYPDLNTISCSVHGLNLLLADIAEIETFQHLISKSEDLIKYFKSKPDLLSIFTEKQKKKKDTAASTLKLPTETKLSGMLIMFKSLIDGKESLQQTVLNESVEVDPEIYQLILENNIFWASIESLVNVLKPICSGISMIESDSAVLSDVPHVFYNINNSLGSLKSTPLQTDEEERFISALEERQKMCCQPIHLAAYVLDPRYQENSLNSEAYKTAIDFITHFPASVLAEEIIADFAQFQSHEGIYSNDAIWSSAKHISPLTWWRGILANQSLSQVAIQLFSIPPSTTACEKTFSVFSNTHTVLKNQLSDDRVAKLVAIRSNLVLQNKLNFDDDEENTTGNYDSD